MKRDWRPVIVIGRAIAAKWGPLILAQLEAGQVVDVAGFRLRLITDDMARPALTLQA